MALHWENPASTTHSLTPRLQNRPLIFEILTPREKPVATGSAGRCELGVGRFTDPHPLTCSFFTPPFCWLMFGLCAPPKILPNPVLCVEKNILFHRGHPVLQCAAFAGPDGSAFLFLPALCPFCLNFRQREARCFSAGKDGYFVSEGFSRQLPLATAAHNRLTRLQQGRSGASLVSFPYLSSIPHTALHRPSCGFVSQNEVTPPPKGGGAGFAQLGVVRLL